MGADAGTVVDAVFDTALADTSSTPDESWLTFTLVSGESFEGELVAVYDTSRWWNPLDGLLYGVFDPTGFAPYPDDRSFRFVLESNVSSMLPAVRPPNSEPYLEFLRAREMVFQGPPLSETSYVITGNNSYHLDEDGFGDFAWDFERTDINGDRFTGAGLQNEDFLVWDEAVLSGVRGEVIEVIAAGPDNVPGSHPEIGTAINNLVGIALGGSFYAYYLHFQQSGVDESVVVGAQVEPGDVLGRAGNSGVSLEPHIHVVLLWFDVAAGRSYSVPAEFTNVLVANSPEGPFEPVDYVVPGSEQWLRATE
jgi:hypothetical protein